MRHVRPLGFDDLESRKLLTKLHHAAVHADPAPASRPAEVAAPLVLDGTLVVNSKAAQVLTDDLGDQTTASPVSGVLGGLGRVRGTWDESVDQYGEYLDPDTIQLQNSRGSFVLAFDATTTGQGQQTAQGMVYNGAPQQLEDGTGAYAKASESGFIQMNAKPRGTVVASLTVSSNNPT
jgi:hypothetical protein